MFFFVHYIVFGLVFLIVAADDDSETQELQSDFNPSNFGEYPSHDQNSDSSMFSDSVPFGSQSEGNYFMDLYSVQTGPKQVEFGHVYENPETWEQRYEKKDHDSGRFQGQHVPKKDHYDFAYKRGNQHHVKEHHEKAVPHQGHFKIQARWGDKHGGYGEHYWDYNHGDEGHDEGSNNDANGASSLKIQSQSLNTPSSSPSDQDEEFEISSTSPPLGSSPPSRRKAQKIQAKKRYQNPPKRIPHNPTLSEQTSNDQSSTDEALYFRIPKTYASSEYPLDLEMTPRSNINKENGPYRVNLYEKLKGVPNIYEQNNERYSAASNNKRTIKVPQTSPKSNIA